MVSNYKIGSETGASQVADNLSKSMSNKHQVMYLCLGTKLKKTKISTNLSVVKFPSIDINNISIPIFTPKNILMLFKIIGGFKPKIIHLHNVLLLTSLVRTWGSYQKVPIVATYHHIPTEGIKHLIPKIDSNIVNTIQNLYNNTSLKTTLKKISGVIAINQEVFNEVRKIDDSIKIAKIPNGIKLDSFTKVDKKLDDANYSFINLGSYNERKNQKYLLDVFKYLPKNFKLFCYGKIYKNDAYFKSLVKTINDHNLSNVEVNDFVDRNKVPNLFKDKHCYISSSLKEAQSLAIIQSLASGTPVIGLKNETINELVNENNGIALSKNTKPKDFSKSIRVYIGNYNNDELVINCRKSIIKFDLKLITLKTYQFYKTICNSYSKNSRRDIGKYDNQILTKLHIINKQSSS